MEKYQEVERSIIKSYRKSIYAKFVRAIETYQLIQENDKIMVCVSGGKDSFLLSKCIEEYQKHGPIAFEAIYVCMDPGYAKENVECIQSNASLMNINLQILPSDVFEVIERENQTCSLCARMRRGFLYRTAKQFGCNKIALGHHFDDAIETTLISMFYGSEIKTMLPKRRSTSTPEIEVIRPLYMVKEYDINRWVTYNNLNFINCACKMTQKGVDSKRKEIKELISKLKETNPGIDDHIFISMHNVNLDSVIEYKKDNQKHSFLDK